MSYPQCFTDGDERGLSLRIHRMPNCRIPCGWNLRKPVKQDWTKDGTGAWFRLSKQRVVEGSGTPRALAVKLLSYCLCLGAYQTHKWDFFPHFFCLYYQSAQQSYLHWLRASYYFHLFTSSLPLLWQGVFLLAFLPSLSYIIYYILFAILFKTSSNWNTFKLKTSYKTEGGGGWGSGIEGQPWLH